ncbi:MAG: DpnD/PcfM family protein [Synergistaceae bacterium]|nr:DpnD/PcfM family protein [Synergistaceae bacterium]
MPKFEVIITETLTKSVIVEAEDKDAAFWKVREDYYDCIHVLDAENFCGVEFETLPADDNAILTEYSDNDIE